MGLTAARGNKFNDAQIGPIKCVPIYYSVPPSSSAYWTRSQWGLCRDFLLCGTLSVIRTWRSVEGDKRLPFSLGGPG